MDQLLAKLDRVMKEGISTRDQANDLLAQCYNAITDLIDRLPEDRTEKQSASRWLYLENMAEQFNNAGIDRQRLLTVIKENAGVTAQNTKETLYHDYWRPVHEAYYSDKKRLSKAEIQIVYESMNNHSGTVFGISAPWPDKYGNWNNQRGE